MENEHQAWAQQMQELLLTIKGAVAKQKENAKLHLELEHLQKFESRYSRIIALGYEENPFVEEKTSGQAGQSEKDQSPEPVGKTG